jgi:hypothetical protein
MSRLIALAALLALAAVPAMAEESCTSSGPAMTKEAMTKSLQDRGYTQIRSLTTHNGCFEAKGIDSKGHRFELEVNASNGQVVNAE